MKRERKTDRQTERKKKEVYMKREKETEKKTLCKKDN